MLIDTDRIADAAATYELCASTAIKADDFLLAMEAYRMASFCRERLMQLDEAGKNGWQALDAAARLDRELRQNTTLPFLGEGLLRIAEVQRDDEGGRQADDALRYLVGPDWRPRQSPGVLVGAY